MCHHNLIIKKASAESEESNTAWYGSRSRRQSQYCSEENSKIVSEIQQLPSDELLGDVELSGEVELPACEV